MEHVDFLYKILGTDKIYIQNNLYIASHLIPSIIEIKVEDENNSFTENVAGILTGFSGAESGYGVNEEIVCRYCT